MAGVISLSEAKAHLRITHTAEDTLIQAYMNAANDYIKNFLNVNTVPNNASTKAAALLIVGGLYENRESMGEKEIKENPAVKSLIYPYRKNIGF